MAKAAAPKEKVETNRKKKEKQRKRTEEEMGIYMANAMFHADETMRLIRKLASDYMPKKEAAEARTRLKAWPTYYIAGKKKGAGTSSQNGLPKW